MHDYHLNKRLSRRHDCGCDSSACT
jgi:hypothetical protein